MINFKNFIKDKIYIDLYLFISITLISIMGLVFLYSASQGNIETIIKQSFFVIFGLFLMFIVSQPDPDFYKNNSAIFLIFFIVPTEVPPNFKTTIFMVNYVKLKNIE